VQRVLILGAGEEIRLEEIERELAVKLAVDEPLVKQDLLALPLREAREQFERAYLQQQLLLCNGKVGSAGQAGGHGTHPSVPQVARIGRRFSPARRRLVPDADHQHVDVGLAHDLAHAVEFVEILIGPMRIRCQVSLSTDTF
jgi:hypothetical protein